jgi:2-methylisocitrate lyase-like PEP mutase family enzyme
MSASIDLPLSADLENGFGDRPEVAAQAVSDAAAAGAVGASLEDIANSGELYPIDLAAARIRAAAEAVRALPFPFLLTARAENFNLGRKDLKETIRRLQAYQDAGADVLFAPGVVQIADMAAIVSSVSRPVNFLAAAPGLGFGVQALAEAGVKRISLGGSLARAALGELLRSAREVRVSGTFSYLDLAATGAELTSIFKQSSPAD